MRVVVTGATGNLGTSLLARLTAEPSIDSVCGVARRTEFEPPHHLREVEWVSADVGVDDLRPAFDGADAVVHLAWAIQPSHDPARLWSTNVAGTRRVLDAVAAAGVPSLVYASSIGAYRPAPDGLWVDETWPVEACPTSFYSRHKAVVEWMLDDFEAAHPRVRVVRFRPALIFKREAAQGIRTLFMGRAVPGRLLPSIPAFPLVHGLAFQVVHTDDVAAAFHSAVISEASGAFNLAAEPVLDTADVAAALDARAFKAPARLLRAAVAASWYLRAQPTPAGWIDMALSVPRMSTVRASTMLDWKPTHSAHETLEELIDGLSRGVGFPTPALATASRRLVTAVRSQVAPVERIRP